MDTSISEKDNQTTDYLKESFDALTQAPNLREVDLEQIEKIYEELSLTTEESDEEEPQYRILRSLGYSFFHNQPKNIDYEILKDITPQDSAKLLFFQARDLEIHRILENADIFNYELSDIIEKVYLYEHHNLNVKNLLLFRPELLNQDVACIEEEITSSKNTLPYSLECVNLVTQLEKEYTNPDRHRNLTKSEEFTLFQGLEDIRRSLKDVSSLLYYKNQIREIVIKYNYRLVYSVAKNYFPLILEDRYEIKQDIVALGTEGLIPAIRKFNHKNGVKFSTVAVPWIRQNITRNIDTVFNSIYAPYHTREKVRKYRLEQISLSEEHSSNLHFEQVWNSLLKKQLVQPEERKSYESVIKSREVISLDNDRINKDKEKDLLIDFLFDKDKLSIPQQIEQKISLEIMAKEIDKLPPKEKEVIELLLDSENPKNLSEISRILNLSVETIRQRKLSAMRNLKQSPILRELYLSGNN